MNETVATTRKPKQTEQKKKSGLLLLACWQNLALQILGDEKLKYPEIEWILSLAPNKHIFN